MDLARLHRDVVFDRSRGRIIWQPRIGCWITDREFAGEPLPAPYTGMSKPEIYRSLSCSARLYEFNVCFVRIEHPSVRRRERPLNARDTLITIETPIGEQRALHRRSLNNPHIIHVKWEVETEDELRVAAWREEHTRWLWDAACYEKLLAQLGDLGAPTMFMPRMNVQSLYIEKMGIERGIYAIHDWPASVEAYFAALQVSHDRLMDVIVESPIEIINYGENIHASTLTPQLFERYHLPEC